MKKKDLYSNICEDELIEMSKHVAFIPTDKPKDNQDCWFQKLSNRTKFNKKKRMTIHSCGWKKKKNEDPSG